MSLSRPQLAGRTRPPAGALTRVIERALLVCLPVLAFAYPMLIQPLMNWQPPSAYAALSDLANVAGAESNVVNQIYWLALLGLVIFFFRRRLDLLADGRRSPVVFLLALYLGWACLSVLWSPVPGIAFRRVVLQIVVTVVVVVPVWLSDRREAVLTGMAWLAVGVVIANALFVAALPPGRLGYLGIYSNKNILGLVASLCFLLHLHAMLARFGLRRLFFLGFALASLALVVISQSKTSLGVVLVAPFLAATLLAARRMVRAPLGPVVLAASLLGALVVGLVSQIARLGFDDLSMLLFGDDTFTGRTQIWDFVLGVYARAPLVGQGYASFWGTGTSSIAFLEAPSFIAGLLQAHNGYLDVMLETGMVGLVILLTLLLCAFSQTGRASAGPATHRWLALSVILFVTLHNLLESSWFRGFGSQWLAFLFALALTLPQPTPRRGSARSRLAMPAVSRQGGSHQKQSAHR